jgi:hypothetical protein
MSSRLFLKKKFKKNKISVGWREDGWELERGGHNQKKRKNIFDCVEGQDALWINRVSGNGRRSAVTRAHLHFCGFLINIKCYVPSFSLVGKEFFLTLPMI